MTNDVISLAKALKKNKALCDAVLSKTKYDKIEHDIEQFRYLHFVREESQYLWESIFYYIRQCLKRVNMLLLGNEDYKLGVSNLFYKELLNVLDYGFISEEYVNKIHSRIANFPLASEVWKTSRSMLFTTDTDVLKGVSGSSGTVVGNARIILKTSDFYKMKKSRYSRL